MLESEEGKAGAAVVKPPPQALRGGWRGKDVPEHVPYVFPSRSLRTRTPVINALGSWALDRPGERTRPTPGRMARVTLTANTAGQGSRGSNCDPGCEGGKRNLRAAWKSFSRAPGAASASRGRTCVPLCPALSSSCRVPAYFQIWGFWGETFMIEPQFKFQVGSWRWREGRGRPAFLPPPSPSISTPHAPTPPPYSCFVALLSHPISLMKYVHNKPL